MGNPEQDFLGTGWSFPPTFSRVDNSVEMVSGETDIHESLWILFSTLLGERIMLPQYGSRVWDMVFDSLTTTFKTLLEDNIREAILNWEPRIDVDAIAIDQGKDEEGLVSVTVDYTIRKTNARSNIVYPFYIQEGTIPAQAP